MSNNIMNAFIIEEYTDKEDKVQKNYFNVGTAIKHTKGGGITLHLAKSVTVSGEIHLFPPKEKRTSQQQ